MAYLHIRIKDVVQETDPTTGALRIKVLAEEHEPRKISINMSKRGASDIARFEALKGKIAMVPLQEGMMNGQTYFKLLDDPIIELPSSGSVLVAVENVDIGTGEIKPEHFKQPDTVKPAAVKHFQTPAKAG